MLNATLYKAATCLRRIVKRMLDQHEHNFQVSIAHDVFWGDVAFWNKICGKDAYENKQDNRYYVALKKINK